MPIAKWHDNTVRRGRERPRKRLTVLSSDGETAAIWHSNTKRKALVPHNLMFASCEVAQP